MPTGKKLLEMFLDGGFPAITPPTTTEGKIRLPVPAVDNPRKDVPVPENMKDLPVDERGYRVPFFVATVDGKPEFRCARPEAIRDCVKNGLCWICGKPHPRAEDGTYPQTYVVGPMCSINHISAEPGSHFDCARYAVRVCPFLIAPNMKRNEKDLPEDRFEPGGMFIKRNPVVMLLWTTSEFVVVPDGKLFVFQFGDPTHVEVWRGGRHATREEVVDSIRTGLPILEDEARKRGPSTLVDLGLMTIEALQTIDRFI